MNRIAGSLLVYITFMATQGTLLCIHKNPTQMSSLREQGYELVTATNGSEGLRLFMSRPVDAIVLEYHLGLLDGATVAGAIKQVRPEVPIVMLTDDLELPDGALKSVDAIVTKTDGAHFLGNSQLCVECEDGCAWEGTGDNSDNGTPASYRQFREGPGPPA